MSSSDAPPPSDDLPPSGGDVPPEAPPPSGADAPSGPPPAADDVPAQAPPPPAAGDVPPEAPPPPAEAYPPPSGGAPGGAPQGTGYPPGQPVGVVPGRLDGPFNSIPLVILLTIVTCGIWGAVWTYRTNEDLKKYNGDGLGGVLGVVIYVLLSVVLMFTIPNEVEKTYQRDGRESPVNALWGLWFLLPIIGNIIWYVKVQRALNDFWVSKGAIPA